MEHPGLVRRIFKCEETGDLIAEVAFKVPPPLPWSIIWDRVPVQIVPLPAPSPVIDGKGK